MQRKVLFIFLASLISSAIFGQSGSLKGTVKDQDSNEPIPFCNVSIQQNGNIVTGGQTDFDGNYHIKPINPGVYDVKISYVGYIPTQMNKLRIVAGVITFQDFKLKQTAVPIAEVTITDYKVPLISKDQTQTGGTVTSEDIQKMPGRSADAIASTVGGVYSEGGSVGSIRGARSEGTVYYIDGVKVIGSNSIPKSALDQVSVITGGLPAQYGDATGGVISMTTKGPAKETHGSVELVTSTFLDPYGYNLGGVYFSGPLITKKVPDRNDKTKTVKTPIVGYSISMDYSNIKDGRPFYNGNWYAKDDVVQQIINNPLRPSSDGNSTITNASFLRSDNFYNTDKKKDDLSQDVNIAGKLDFRISKNIFFLLGGTFDYSKSRIYDMANSLFNSNNNGEQLYNNTRAYARFTQKFTSDLTDKEASASTIKNAFYSLKVDYSRVNSIVEDVNHKDNFFDYGYIGKFKTYSVNTYAFTDTFQGFPQGVVVRNGYRDTAITFQPSSINPELSQWTSKYYSLYRSGDYHYSNRDNLLAGGGLMNGDFPESIYGLYNSPGVPYTSYQKSIATQFSIGASGSADIYDHEISFGFDFEQRNSSYYSVAPYSLWTLARNLTNFHLLQLDKSNPIYVTDANGVFQNMIDYNWLYNQSAQTRFDINLRKSLGVPVDGKDWLDLDTYDPSQLSINYFSPDELLNNGRGYVGYSGFDAYGKQLTSKPTLNDFFTAKDANGDYKREVAPFSPNYSDFYIQDKFAFYDLIFSIGLRVDRYDANQQVLKDLYCFYDTKKVRDIPVNSSLYGTLGNHPSNIGNDYVVYVDNIKSPSSITGYRSGTDPANVKWYNASGVQVATADKIAGSSGQVQPYLVDPNGTLSASGFETYTPQINPMPRISFSFPISDVALFFAHYDILTKRPTEYEQMNPMNYMFIVTSNEISNPNLKPEKTIDYELGFKQKVSSSSSISISAFYREMRDQNQEELIVGAYPIDYLTFANIDFGTVKGLGITYDLRQTGNVSLRADYTLQFANGTGSDAQTSKGLITSGQPNIRTTIPLNIDQRHAFKIDLDYRFASGRAYNGPKWLGMDILENTGANLTIIAGSGTPYSRRDINTSYLVGSMNGSRKPFKTSMNLKIDRDINLTFGKKDGKKGKEASLNVYVELQNVLNQKNIISVYSTTGNPNDDGYLAAAKNQQDIKSKYDEIAFRNYYTMNVDNPYNYELPRRIRFGVLFSF